MSPGELSSLCISCKHSRQARLLADGLHGRGKAPWPSRGVGNSFAYTMSGFEKYTGTCGASSFLLLPITPPAMDGYRIVLEADYTNSSA